MIKTNQWTVSELVKYLASIRATLSDDELLRLKNTNAFSKEVTEGEVLTGPNRFQARQLYEPLDVFRKLRLPVLDWGQKGKWRGSSEEGEVVDRWLLRCTDPSPAKFLFELGLQRYPPLGTLISLCMDQDTEASPLIF